MTGAAELLAGMPVSRVLELPRRAPSPRDDPGTDVGRRQRLAARGMTEDEIEHAVYDATVLRDLGAPVLRSTGTVAETAERVAGWLSSTRQRR